MKVMKSDILYEFSSDPTNLIRSLAEVKRWLTSNAYTCLHHHPSMSPQCVGGTHCHQGASLTYPCSPLDEDHCSAEPSEPEHPHGTHVVVSHCLRIKLVGGETPERRIQTLCWRLETVRRSWGLNEAFCFEFVTFCATRRQKNANFCHPAKILFIYLKYHNVGYDPTFLKPSSGNGNWWRQDIEDDERDNTSPLEWPHSKWWEGEKCPYSRIKPKLLLFFLFFSPQR